jgi:hypothetical protein
VKPAVFLSNHQGLQGVTFPSARTMTARESTAPSLATRLPDTFTWALPLVS